MPDDVAALLVAEKARVEEPPAELEERVWSRVAATVGLTPPGGGDDGGPGDGGTAPPGNVTGGPGLDGAALGTAGVAHGAGGWLTGSAAKVAIAAALLGAGGAGGIAIDRVVAPEARVVVVRVPLITRTAPADGPTTAAVRVREVAPPDVTSTPVDAPPHRAPSPSDSSAPSTTRRDLELGAERAILERARAALGRGDSSGALVALEDHAARFPRARLGDEREALWVQALIGAGRRGEAEARFARFRARSPSSMLVPVIEAMLEGGR